MDYHRALNEIQGLLKNKPASRACQDVVNYLNDHFQHYKWVGIYWVQGTDLVLGPWKGPEATEHTRIPIGKGVCGAAAASGQTEIVDDVSKDPRYLACFPYTQSEIVVPIFHQGQVVGEIDIDGSTLAAFGAKDREFLERVAEWLGQSVMRDT